MKAWYTSKTLWVSLVIFVASALRAAGVDVPLITEDSMGMNMAISVIFFILRLVTKKEVTPTK